MAGEATATLADIPAPRQRGAGEPLALLYGRASSSSIVLPGTLRLSPRAVKGIFPPPAAARVGTDPQHPNGAGSSKRD